MPNWFFLTPKFLVSLRRRLPTSSSAAELCFFYDEISCLRSKVTALNILVDAFMSPISLDVDLVLHFPLLRREGRAHSNASSAENKTKPQQQFPNKFEKFLSTFLISFRLHHVILDSLLCVVKHMSRHEANELKERRKS